jgi:hypothetical protein
MVKPAYKSLIAKLSADNSSGMHTLSFLAGGSKDMLHSGFSTRLITSVGNRLADCSLAGAI